MLALALAIIFGVILFILDTPRRFYSVNLIYSEFTDSYNTVHKFVCGDYIRKYLGENPKIIKLEFYDKPRKGAIRVVAGTVCEVIINAKSYSAYPKLYKVIDKFPSGTAYVVIKSI